MKKIILMLLALSSKCTYAQVNYHFDDPPGVLVSPSTFNGDPGNWQRSHGSPTWEPSEIFMWHDGFVGEGIYQDDVFHEGGKYKIEVGIKKAAFGGQIKVFAAEGLTPTLTPDWGEKIPTPAIAPILIGKWNTHVDPTAPQNWIVDADFINTSSNRQIWIRAEQDTDIIGYNYKCRIDWVTVCRYIKNGINYDIGTLPYGSHYRTYYNIGSCFSGSGMVQNDILRSTHYDAREYINMCKNISIEVTDGNYSQAEIDPR